MGNTLINYNPRENASDEAPILHPLFYPNGGLYHSMDVLNTIYPEIIHWPIEKQMDYADAITRRYCLNSHFLKTQPSIMPSDLNKLNATSIGNIACLAYYNGLDSQWGHLYTELIKRLKEK